MESFEIGVVSESQRWERLSKAVKTIAVATGSLLAVYVAPIPDFPKGFLLGVMTTTYASLVLHFLPYPGPKGMKPRGSEKQQPWRATP